MANPWFRLYSEFATDPKVQMLSETDQRRFIMLLCLRCSNGSETLHDDEIAFQLRISETEWQQTKSILMAKNMVDQHGKPLAWDKRQYLSDSSTARVKAHRVRMKQACNVSVTAPDTDTDTDTELTPHTPLLDFAESEISGDVVLQQGNPKFQQFWDLYPRRGRGKCSRTETLKKWEFKKLDAKSEEVIAGLRRWINSDDWQKNDGVYIPGTLPFLNQKKWEAEPIPASEVKNATNSNLGKREQANERYIKRRTEAIQKQAAGEYDVTYCEN
jgi:hypothetical protein